MMNDHFDLNDIEHEPSDEQLQTLMEQVSNDSQHRAVLARASLMQRLRDDIIATNHS